MTSVIEDASCSGVSGVSGVSAGAERVTREPIEYPFSSGVLSRIDPNPRIVHALEEDEEAREDGEDEDEWVGEDL